MHQLDTSCFSSQIFWVLIGFCMIYYIVTYMLIPALDSILYMRQSALEKYSKEIISLRSSISSIQDGKNVLIKGLEEGKKREIADIVRLHNREVEKIKQHYRTLYDQNMSHVHDVVYNKQNVDNIVKYIIQKQ